MAHMTRRALSVLALAAGALALAPHALAQDASANDFIQSMSDEVLQLVRQDKALQSAEIGRVMEVVDNKIMPHVNFVRMTASATGPAWRRATPQQRQQLQDEFKTLLVRTYAGAIRQVSDQTVEVQPMRGGAADKEVVVRTLVKGRGEPVQLDYRLERTPGQGRGWKVYDLNVMGVWLVDNYRPQFSQQINAGGVDALIRSLAERNRNNAVSAQQ